MVYGTRRYVHQCNDVTVHLLNKIWDCTKLGTAKRNLFGYYENKVVYQLLDRQVSNMSVKSQQEWNFDFLKESPKTGRYLWQKVPNFEVPLLYATVSRPALKDILRQNACIEEIHTKDPAQRKKESSELPKNKENDIEKINQPLRKKQRLVQTTMKGKFLIFLKILLRNCLLHYLHLSDSETAGF